MTYPHEIPVDEGENFSPPSPDPLIAYYHGIRDPDGNLCLGWHIPVQPIVLGAPITQGKYITISRNPFVFPVVLARIYGATACLDYLQSIHYRGALRLYGANVDAIDFLREFLAPILTPKIFSSLIFDHASHENESMMKAINASCHIYKRVTGREPNFRTS